jgi:hypothetical protein
MKFIGSNARTRAHLERWTEHHPKVLEGLYGAETGQNSSPTRKRLEYEADLVKSSHQRQSELEDDGAAQGRVSRLVTARYFFWNAGSRLQKSQEGLLRSLLFDVLRQCPELVPHVLRTRSSYRGFAGTANETPSAAAAASWSFEELLLTLENVISVRISATFCLFIDGLDEFQEEDKRTYRDLIDTLNLIAKLPNAKICTSSRPWTMFLDAFHDISACSLKLEDLTRRDIRRYVSDKFEQHDQYIRLRAYDSAYENLIEEIATRAQGVFLWVYLVVKDLLEGLTYKDSVQTMIQRLDQFPEDLEDFFQHMIESIPALYRRQAARTFIISMEAPNPLLLILHSFLDDIEADPQFCVSRAQGSFTPSELAFRHERMRRQLEGRTKGLLEVVPEPGELHVYFAARVDFLHRTVRDFLRSSSKVQALMTNGQEDVSKTWVLLCRGILAEIRYAPFMAAVAMFCRMPSKAHDANWLGQFLHEFAYFAEKALDDANNTSTVTELFKEVEGAIAQTKVFLENEPDIIAHALCQYGLFELMEQMDYDWSPQSAPVLTASRVPLLQSALYDFTGPPRRQQDVVTYLLKCGANPNQEWEHLRTTCPFQEYMEMVHSTGPVSGQEGHHVFRVVETLVKHGADLSTSVRDTRGDMIIWITAQEVLHRRLPPQLASRILDIVLLSAKKAWQLPLASGVEGPAHVGIETGSRSNQPQPQPQPQGQAQTSPGQRAARQSRLRRWICC